MEKTTLITASDDRQGRKGGLYEKTQGRIQDLFGNWIKQKHWKLLEFMDCDPLMINVDGGKNGRVYKPWVIQRTLHGLQDGDFLIYNDCSPELWPETLDLSKYDLDVIRELTIQNQDILVGFVKWDTKPIGQGELGIHVHENFTSDSCIEIMGGEAYRYSFLCASGMIVIRKSQQTIDIMEEWLRYNRSPECSCFNVHEQEDHYYAGGRGRKLGNRHDQSVLSMVLNQHNVNYCDIVYNDMNPYNFLNFCLPDHKYEFINSNQRQL